MLRFDLTLDLLCFAAWRFRQSPRGDASQQHDVITLTSYVTGPAASAAARAAASVSPPFRSAAAAGAAAPARPLSPARALPSPLFLGVPENDATTSTTRFPGGGEVVAVGGVAAGGDPPPAAAAHGHGSRARCGCGAPPSRPARHLEARARSLPALLLLPSPPQCRHPQHQFNNNSATATGLPRTQCQCQRLSLPSDQTQLHRPNGHAAGRSAWPALWRGRAANASPLEGVHQQKPVSHQQARQVPPDDSLRPNQRSRRQGWKHIW